MKPMVNLDARVPWRAGLGEVLDKFLTSEIVKI